MKRKRGDEVEEKGQDAQKSNQTTTSSSSTTSSSDSTGGLISGDTWEQHYDQSYKRNYFYNRRTGESIWHKPPATDIIIPSSRPTNSASVTPLGGGNSLMGSSSSYSNPSLNSSYQTSSSLLSSSSSSSGVLGGGESLLDNVNSFAPLSSHFSDMAYLDKRYAPTDYAGQQMYEYFDPSQLEKNRAEMQHKKKNMLVLL